MDNRLAGAVVTPPRFARRPPPPGRVSSGTRRAPINVASGMSYGNSIILFTLSRPS